MAFSSPQEQFEQLKKIVNDKINASVSALVEFGVDHEIAKSVITSAMSHKYATLNINAEPDNEKKLQSFALHCEDMVFSTVKRLFDVSEQGGILTNDPTLRVPVIIASSLLSHVCSAAITMAPDHMRAKMFLDSLVDVVFKETSKNMSKDESSEVKGYSNDAFRDRTFH